jgi:AcrR family transcriptional regulator
MKEAASRHARTRRAILDALAAVIAESDAFGFSVQQVADRAGVTHRTVYNHFPTRQDLNDGFAEYVEQRLAERVDGKPDEHLAPGSLPEVVRQAFPAFDALDSHVRAYVRLMVASRAPAKVARERTVRLRDDVVAKLRPMSPRARAGVAAALRMFLSSTGWHLMTEHYGLETSEAVAVAEWAIATLTDAVKRGKLPEAEG